MRLHACHGGYHCVRTARLEIAAGRKWLCVSILLALCTARPTMLFGQQAHDGSDPDRKVDPTATGPATPSDKRIFGIIPNYRTSPSLTNYVPLRSSEKFRIASQDAFDRGTFIMAAAFAGEAQLTDSNPTFAQGVRGYAHYFGTATADLVIGDFMTEAVVPSLLHQDPRYFRKGSGGGLSRLGYAAGQIFWTHTDAGGTQFNFSEIVGNSAAVALSNIYYPDSRNASDALMRLGTQIGVDMVANILKEFWPDLNRKLSRRK